MKEGFVSVTSSAARVYFILFWVTTTVRKGGHLVPPTISSDPYTYSACLAGLILVLKKTGSHPINVIRFFIFHE